jgi:Type IV secretion-system coupling protein DNA-binding domain
MKLDCSFREQHRLTEGLPSQRQIGPSMAGLAYVIIGKHNKDLYNVSEDDRRRHFYVVGQTGVGKTSLLVNMIRQDMEAGEGICFIDPHGDAIEEVLKFVPWRRSNDLIYINPADMAFPVAYNSLYNVPPDDRPRVADNIVEAMRSVWWDSWGPRMEWQLVNFVRTLLDASSSLIGLNHISTNAAFREKCIRSVRDPSVLAFWDFWEGLKPNVRQDWIAPILNKVGRLVGSPAVRNILGQSESTIDIRRAMDEKRILLVNLSKGKLGDENAHLLGALLVSGIVQAALSRSDIPESERVPFHLYVDEFQSFSTRTFETALSEARKYALTVCAANQFTSQLPESLRNAVLGNVGNVISFRVGADDPPLLGRHLDIAPQALQDLSNYQARGRFIVGGRVTEAMFLETLPPPKAINRRVSQMVKHSQMRFGRDRKVVEERINKFLS